MQFKFKNIKITVSFTFFALIILLVIFNKNDFLYFGRFYIKKDSERSPFEFRVMMLYAQL